ncbi:MAG: hypothetical protein KAV00_08495, partial [Phycisphaerae bacterium]|nr:hypothetical protein [Phycisphaerae bacterium]
MSHIAGGWSAGHSEAATSGEKGVMIMSRTTVLLVGLMLVGLIVSPALAQTTTVTFRDQHEGPDEPITPDPTMSNFGHLIQHNMFLGDYTYWRKDRQHTDSYNAWGMVPANGNTYAPLMDYDEMIGPDTTTYEGSYVGQIPHGAVIHSAELTLWRTNYGDDMVNIGVRQVMDPDNLEHWGANTDDPSWDPGSNGWKLGAGWLTRNSYPDADPDIPWKNYEEGVDPVPTFTDILDPAESTVDFWYGGIGMYDETWTTTNMTQNWADCLRSRQGFAMTSDSGGGEIFGGQNSLFVRPTLVVSFTPSLGGDAN